MALKIYTNESVPVAVAIGLRQRGIEARSARDASNLGLSDCALGTIVCDVLGLTAGEREAVYEAVVELVKRRLEKARSV